MTIYILWNTTKHFSMGSTFYERSNKMCAYRWRNWYETHTKQLQHQINSFTLSSKFISFLARKNLLVPLYCPWWVDKTMIFAFLRALDWQTINLSINFGRLFIPTLCVFHYTFCWLRRIMFCCMADPICSVPWLFPLPGLITVLMRPVAIEVIYCLGCL